MARFPPSAWARFQRRCILIFGGPPVLAFIPAISLAVYWFGGEGALIVLAGVLPVIYLVGASLHDRDQIRDRHFGHILAKPDFDAHAADIFQQSREKGHSSAYFRIALEDFDELAGRFGQMAADTVTDVICDRLTEVIRDADKIGQFAPDHFAICTDPVRQLDLELCIQVAARLQTIIEEPISVDGLGVYVTASIGFCLRSRAPGDTAAEWANAAAAALAEAQTEGPASIRAYSKQSRARGRQKPASGDEITTALNNGQMQPWFQPQISTDTGQITGFEALVRWNHPSRGILSPASFLPALESAGQLERLAELMMYNSFAALKAWDGAGVDVPQVGVNFAGSELANPKLLEKSRMGTGPVWPDPGPPRCRGP